uniref:Uncharacterized protein n=1 Tax=Arundo donax TaxID=35708 RepID=A0A0A9C3C3_ARUDO
MTRRSCTEMDDEASDHLDTDFCTIGRKMGLCYC